LKILLLISAAALVVQMLYFILFFSRISFHRDKKHIPATMEGVSIIICAKNESVQLKKNLSLILEQDYPEFEVIVVNDCSEDDSLDYLYAMAAQYPRLQIRDIKQESKVIQGKKYPLTIGIKAAMYDKVLLTDADCSPVSNQWIRLMTDAYTDTKEIVIGYAPYEKQKGFLNKWIRFDTFYSGLQYLSFSKAGLTYMGVGRNLSYKKKIFFDNNVFVKRPELFSGDDDLFINAVAKGDNATVQLAKESFMISEPKTTWESWTHQKERHLSTARYYRGIHKFLLALLPFMHVVFYVFLILTLLYSSDWKYAMILLLGRWVIEGIIFYPSMKRLNEKDIFSLFPLFDILLCVYYIRFISPALVTKTSKWK
jgi:glycosyltransferase involved in cell wall biosynthesis